MQGRSSYERKVRPVRLLPPLGYPGGGLITEEPQATRRPVDRGTHAGTLFLTYAWGSTGVLFLSGDRAASLTTTLPVLLPIIFFPKYEKLLKLQQFSI